MSQHHCVEDTGPSYAAGKLESRSLESSAPSYLSS